jgi:WD40 repeat protein
MLGMAFSPDGKILAFGQAKQGVVKLWEMPSGKELRVLELGEPREPSCTSLAFSSDGRMLAAGTTQSRIRVWDLTTSKPLFAVTAQEQLKAIGALVFSPDGKMLVSATANRTTKVWDTATGQELQSSLTQTISASGVAFAPDGKLLAGVSNYPGEGVKLWDPATWTALRTLRFSGRGYALAVRPDGQVVAAGCADGKVRFWDPARGVEQPALSLPASDKGVFSVAYSPEGRYLATGNSDGTVYILRVDLLPASGSKP